MGKHVLFLTTRLIYNQAVALFLKWHRPFSKGALEQHGLYKEIRQNALLPMCLKIPLCHWVSRWLCSSVLPIHCSQLPSEQICIRSLLTLTEDFASPLQILFYVFWCHRWSQIRLKAYKSLEGTITYAAYGCGSSKRPPLQTGLWVTSWSKL